MSTLDRSARSSRCARQVSDYLLALRVGLWIIALPGRLRLYSLPGLLKRLTPQRSRSRPIHEADLNRATRIVRRVARLPVFELSVFPRICLRQSLALYWILRKVDPSCEIHFGVHKDDDAMRAHCWVTVHGDPVLDHSPLASFQHLYSYPAPAAKAAWELMDREVKTPT